MPHILQSSARKLKVQNTELFKKKIYRKIISFNEYMNILDLPATIQVGKI